jgi:hypothetical protein
VSQLICHEGEPSHATAAHPRAPKRKKSGPLHLGSSCFPVSPSHKLAPTLPAFSLPNTAALLVRSPPSPPKYEPAALKCVFGKDSNTLRITSGLLRSRTVMGSHGSVGRHESWEPRCLSQSRSHARKRLRRLAPPRNGRIPTGMSRGEPPTPVRMRRKYLVQAGGSHKGKRRNITKPTCSIRKSTPSEFMCSVAWTSSTSGASHP